MRLRHLALLLATFPLAAQEPNFGRAMASTDSELLVGQPVNWYGPGTVYGYRIGGDGRWQVASRITAGDAERMDDFGRALAVDGNTMVVAAPRKRDGAGVVYLFSRTGGNAPWQQQQVIEAPAGGEFGASLALAGDDLLVGAPGVDSVGAAYHYRRNGAAWQHAGNINAPSGTAAGSGFGSSLSLDGNHLLVGAPGMDQALGGVFAVDRSTTGAWGAAQAVSIPRVLLTARARLGSALLIDGNRAWVGAPGAALVFELERDERGWSLADELRPFDQSRGSQFGAAMALVGRELWVGAPGGNRGNGGLYRFMRSDGNWVGALRINADSADGTHWPFAFGYAITALPGGTAAVSTPSRDFGEGRVLVLATNGTVATEQQQLMGEIHQVGGAPAQPGRCRDGSHGAFTCNNIEVVSHLPTSALGGERGAWVNDVWGWSDPVTRRDYALVARRDGTSFVDLTDPAAPRLVGDLPRTAGSPPSVWRDIKTIGNHAYIVADGAGAHGVQVFDLTRLRSVAAAPVVFAPDSTYHGVFSAHNIVADTASRFLYVVGANGGGESCGGGLHMVDARDPVQLKFLGCYHNPGGSASSRGYTHDAQCVVYHGPDAEHRGKQICVGSNETEINISDVTDKSAPKLIGRNSYPNVAYAHQGWFDADQKYFYMNDEGDELAGLVEGTRTIVWDLTDLDDPVVAHMYIGPVKSSDHNLYVVGDRVYESNYGSGLRVLDISDRTAPREVAFFDSAPLNDDGPGHSAAQSGAWSNYPFFKSGVVVFTSVREGLFVVRVAPEVVP